MRDPQESMGAVSRHDRHTRPVPSTSTRLPDLINRCHNKVLLRMGLNGVLAGAGFVAGAMNSIAGGGTFVTLPALTFVGLPPTIANASSTVALFPGTLASSWAYRHDVRPLERVGTASLLPLSLLGGLTGALLLLFTPERLF